MPQLEFTIWFSNAIINWTIFMSFILIINSSAFNYLHLPAQTQYNSHLTNNNLWPWL
uniref:ATP synthase F0 subunit 8 n=1 Tax=Ophiothrix scotiosa TaxID=3135525 RepID=A0AAU6PXG0_9ECHI